MKLTKKKAFSAILGGSLLFGSVAVAGHRVVINPPGNVNFRCTGGMSNHGHVFSEGTNEFGANNPTGMSIFEGDPDVIIDNEFITYDTNFGTPEEPFLAGFRLDTVSFGTHSGTHIDVPTHFDPDPNAQQLNELAADEFVWEVYVIDVRERMQDEAVFQLTSDDIRQYERENGKIKRGSLVIIQTGQEEFFGTPAFFNDAPGFSEEAVNWLFDNRYISGLGADTYGPDATNDDGFSATDTTLRRGGVAVVAMNNLDDLAIRGDLLMAPAVRLENGTGFPVNPISCQGNKSEPRFAPGIGDDVNDDD